MMKLKNCLFACLLNIIAFSLKAADPYFAYSGDNIPSSMFAQAPQMYEVQAFATNSFPHNLDIVSTATNFCKSADIAVAKSLPSQTAGAYAFQMFMDAEQTYEFTVEYDDRGIICVDGECVADGTYASHDRRDYRPLWTGWHTVDLLVWNNGGEGGATGNRLGLRWRVKGADIWCQFSATEYPDIFRVVQANADALDALQQVRIEDAILGDIVGIPDRLFAGQSALTNLTIQGDVAFVGKDAFEGCDSLRTIHTGVGGSWYLKRQMIARGFEVESIDFIEPDYEYTIEFDFENIDGSIEPMVCKSNEDVILPNEGPYWENHLITGWALRPNGDRVFKAGEVVRNLNLARNGTLRLYAIWEELWSNRISNGEVVIIASPNLRGDVVMPETIYGYPVIGIADNAFYNNTNITGMKISDTVKNIGSSAFRGASSLRWIILPKSLTIINPGVFYECSSLKSVEIPSGVEEISQFAFTFCRALASVTLPENLIHIGYCAFEVCGSLREITIPNHVAQIDHGAFALCGLNNFVFPTGIGKISSSVLSQCFYLRSVTIPTSVTAIDGDAFIRCIQLKTVYVEYGDATRVKELMRDKGVDVDGLSFVETEVLAPIRYENLMGATHLNPATYRERTSVEFSPPSDVEGYTFVGWEPAAITAEMRGEQVVTAKWKANTYTIAYNANGGSGTMANTAATYDQEVLLSACGFERDGYVFAGWSLEQTVQPESAQYRVGDCVRNLTTQQGDVMTLYAVWKVPVKVTAVTAQQRYPGKGLVDIEVQLSGTVEELSEYVCTFAATNVATKAELATAHIEKVGEDVGSGTGWTWHFVWDAKADLGDVTIDEVELSAFLMKEQDLGGVQLWENGPYWAECNVGAIKPEEYGYYFWWGDTVGYKRNAENNGWVSVLDGASFSFSWSNCPTYGNSNSQLLSLGYIDSTGNLAAAHDAATAHLGAPWRMPTYEEFAELLNKCNMTWTMRNGVYGLLITGRGAYASNSIYLPAAGMGDVSRLTYSESDGIYWSATPYSSNTSRYAWYLNFDSDNDYGLYTDDDRLYGQSVRPVRSDADTEILDAKAVSTHFAYISIIHSAITYTNLMGATHTNPDQYQEGTEVTFTPPSEVEGYTFVGWEPAAITGTMTGPQAVQANWVKKETPPDPPAHTPPTWTQLNKEDTMVVYATVYDRQSKGNIEASGALLGAFDANGECRGVATIMDGPVGKLFQLSIGVESATEKGIILKVWNPATGETTEIAERVDCNAEKQIGQIFAPVAFEIGALEMSITVNTGWNWMSIGLVPEDNKISAVLSGATFANGDIVKSVNATATYYNGLWYPATFTIEPGKAYMVKKTAGGEESIVISGASAESTIEVAAGWNWIGSPLLSVQDVNSISHSAGFTNGDMIKSVSKSATYYNGQWYPSDFAIEPGIGYKAKVAKPGTLMFVELTSKARKAAASFLSAPSSKFSAPTFKPVAQEDTMVVYATIVDGSGAAIETDGSMLVAFAADGECRGVTTIMEGPLGKLYQLSVGVASATEKGVALKVWDAATGKLMEVEEKIDSNTDKQIGQIFAPVTYHAKSAGVVAPSVEGDGAAEVSGDAESGFVVKPSAGTTEVVITIPEGVAAEKVTIEVLPSVETVKANGATINVVKGEADITGYLTIPAAVDGVVNLGAAVVKPEIVREALDPEKGAVIDFGSGSQGATSPTITTAETRPGLTYTLFEGETLDAMVDGDSKLGDGSKWTPEIKVKGGASGFYTIKVTK